MRKTKGRINPILIFVIIFSFGTQLSQINAQSALDIGLEWQQYPTGSIPGIRMEKPIGKKGAGILKLGYNTFDHKDLGVQDQEEGNGFGFTLGYKHFFKEERKHWSLALKNDVWWNEVNWRDVTTDPETFGVTKITVLQPTAELGYTFLIGESFFLAPHVAFGVEWNVKTVGVPTGEGPILLGGVTAGLRL